MVFRKWKMAFKKAYLGFLNEIIKKNIRIIPRFDIKGPNLIKGIQLEGLRLLEIQTILL